MVKNLIIQLIAATILFFANPLSAMEVPIYDFALKNYSQNINDFLNPNSQDYESPLLSQDYQKQQLERFYNHYFASDAQGLSPWSENFVKSVLSLVKKMELESINEFNNQNKAPQDRHYAENFKEQSQEWWLKIKQNMNLDSLDNQAFNPDNRAIAVANTLARTLPDQAPDFYQATLPGQGFPFDNLQDSAIWAGTPLYVIATSKDKAWSLVLTPDLYFGWMNSRDLTYASSEFIQQWQQAAKRSLAAISKTETSVVDGELNFQFKSYIGAVFPLIEQTPEQISLLIPIKNEHNQAQAKQAFIAANAAVQIPLIASKKNFANLIKELKNRPYGWGGAFFFNDCSQEMKSLFTPFAIWLPRNSNAQSELNPSLDLTSYNMDERLAKLKEKGHPLMTLVNVGGHVLLYLGSNEKEAMSYQNVWGLSPKNKDKRFIIGQSVLLPLLKTFPENTEISSQANRNVFKLIYLDELEKSLDSPKTILKFLKNEPEKPGDPRD